MRDKRSRRTDLSPFWRFPTDFGAIISLLPHDTAPTPVNRRPFENLVFALAKAARPTHVLIYEVVWLGDRSKGVRR